MELEIYGEHVRRNLFELFDTFDYPHFGDYDSLYNTFHDNHEDGSQEIINHNSIPGSYQYIQASHYEDGDLNPDALEERDDNYSADELSLPSSWDQESEEEVSAYSAGGLSLPSDSEWDDDYYTINYVIEDLESGYDAEEEADHLVFENHLISMQDVDVSSGDEAQGMSNDDTGSADTIPGDYIFNAGSRSNNVNNDASYYEDGDYSADELSLPSDWATE